MLSYLLKKDTSLRGADRRRGNPVDFPDAQTGASLYPRDCTKGIPFGHHGAGAPRNDVVIFGLDQPLLGCSTYSRIR